MWAPSLRPRASWTPLVMLKRSLAMKVELHGEGVAHPDVAASLNNVGGVLKAKDQLDAALVMHERSLAMFVELHAEGVAHPAGFSIIAACPQLSIQNKSELGNSL